MTGRIRSRVQDAHDQDAAYVFDIADDVGAVLETAQSRRERFGAPARQRVLREVFEAGFKLFAIAARLFDTEGLV